MQSLPNRIYVTAYHVLKSSHAAGEFSSLLHLQNMNGMYVGSLNHSTWAFSKLRDAFSSTIAEKVRRFCEESPAVSIVADRVTLKRKTVDILAIQAIIPGAKTGDMMQCPLLDAPVVQKHDGDSMAKVWASVVSQYGINRVKQIAAIGTDGQYLHNKVPQKFLVISTESSYVPAIWDHAHLLEHATKVEKMFPWVAKTNSVIQKISKLFKNGYGFQRCEDQANEMGIKFLKPSTFCETRWSSYASNVYKTFINNAPVYKEVLIRNSYDEYLLKKDIQCFLENFNSTMQLNSALHDVYCVVAKGSCSLSNLQKIPWEKAGDIKNISKELVDMRDCLNHECSPEKLKQNWPTLEVIRLSQSQISLITNVLSQLNENIIERMRGCDSRGSRYGSSNELMNDFAKDLKLVGDLAAARLFWSAISFRSAAIMNAIDWLKRAQIIPSSIHITRECIEVFMTALCKHRKDQVLCNQDLYKHMNKISEGSVFIKTYLHLVNRIWISMPRESVVESIASVLKDVFAEHRNLDHCNAKKELFVRWNGPTTNRVSKILEGVESKLHMNPGVGDSGTVLTRLSNQYHPLDSIY